MSFISVFDVMGPNMIGPSSSHTAGAARISYLAQKMIEGPLKRAVRRHREAHRPAALLQKLTMVTVLTELCWVVLWDSLLMICASEILLILLMKKV